MKAANTAHWDGFAPRWRALGVPEAKYCRALVAKLGCAPGSFVLDAGCGAGRWSVVLVQEGYRVRGVDLSPGMIAEAGHLARELELSDEMLELTVGDVEQLDLPDIAVDAIICRNVLDFVPAPGVALSEFWRVLRPGGHLVLATLGAYSPVKRRFWRRFLPADGDAGPTIGNSLLPWEVEALLEEAGWEILAREASFGPSASGQPNEYATEGTSQLTDPVLLQAVASSWEVVARKAGHVLDDASTTHCHEAHSEGPCCSQASASASISPSA